MAKYYLDPKQTEGPHDVKTRERWFRGWQWVRLPVGRWMPPEGELHFYATEAEALTAARKAAGYETEE